MKKFLKTANVHLKSFFIALFFGGLWGLLEASLGTLLHLDPIKHFGNFACSTTVMLPIAYFLMGLAYKKDGRRETVCYMGLIAATIKFSLVFILGFIQSVYMPTIFIMLESLSMAVALGAVKPSKMLNKRGLLTLAIASTTYLLAFLTIKSFQVPVKFASLETWKTYLITRNVIMLSYAFIAGLIVKGVSTLIKTKNRHFSFNKLQTALFNPITATCVFMLAVSVTLLLK